MKNNEIADVLKEKTMFPLNIQFFADDDGGDNATSDDDVTDEELDDDDESDEDDDDEEDKLPKRKAKKKNRTFSQNDVKRISAREKRQGKKSVLSELGVDSVEDAKKIIDTFKKLMDVTQTDEQKYKNVSSKSKERIASAERRAQIAEARLTAVEMGVKPKFAKDIVAIAMAKVDDIDEIEDVIEEMSESEAYSGFFIPSDDDEESEEYAEDDLLESVIGKKKKNAKKKMTGSRVKHSNAFTSMDAESIGKSIAEDISKRNKESKKSYYFSN